MLVILPVESAQSEDPITMAPVGVWRVTVQLTDTEAQAIVNVDSAANQSLCFVVAEALAEAGVTP